MADAEKLFMSGMSGTTPLPDRAVASWQKPWLYARAFVLFIILTLLSYYLAKESGIQLFSLIGSSVIPLTVLVFVWEMNIYRNIPLYMVVLMFICGGIFSILFTLLNAEVRNLLSDSVLAVNFMNGVLEEGAKLLTIVIFALLGRGKYRGILPGMLIGCAVGSGFAVFESWQYFDNYGGSIQLMFIRAVSSPGTHAVWAAMYGGGLLADSGTIGAKNFTSKIFLITFGAAVGLHTLWNTLAGSTLILIGLIVAAWVIMIKLFSLGVSQAANGGNSFSRPHGNYAPQANYAQPQANYAQPQANYAAPIMAAAEYSITFINGTFAGKTIPISGTITIGRDPSYCNLIMDAGTGGISRVHCRLFVSNGLLIIEDLGSSSGTFLESGERVTQGIQKVLQRGQKVYLGSRNVMFSVG
jgi:RsiW-degrading membrane proteinase PrsW (M82 family)